MPISSKISLVFGPRTARTSGLKKERVFICRKNRDILCLRYGRLNGKRVPDPHIMEFEDSVFFVSREPMAIRVLVLKGGSLNKNFLPVIFSTK